MELVRTDFKLRYHNSILGFFWVLLKPFLIFSVIFTVFSYFFISQDPYYRLNLLLGILVFSYFSEGTIRGLTSLYDKSNIILKVSFPPLVAVLAPVFNSLLNFLFGFLIFSIFFIASDLPISIMQLVFAALLIILFTLFIIGISLFSSILFIRFRDLQSLWEIALQLLFYATLVIYPLTFVPHSILRLILLNPIAVTIVELRSILISPAYIHYKGLGITILLTILLLIFGNMFFNTNVRRIAEYF